MQKVNILTVFILLIFISCEKSREIKPGEIKYLNLSNNYAIGTDSTIVIINKDTGKTLNIIKRKN
ncbi:hypothetical protein PG911_08710 [Tenacibaculum ovolyticum]|uniref:hypothetical protein n=1 Tax=Tenacibaculum ovolyticum TaxID=104270 RepID=UPI0022F3A057|nr:hypothetical protein [Tenacibaculum ovolyticum]WBX78326.1 hypothetical protein PG911_08710 [Tenacibaculum ovolyticum]